MKRLLFALTVSFSLISLSSFADSGKVAPNAVKSFRQSFRNASDVSWTTTADLYKVNFNMAGQYVTAFYDGDGKMVALTRNISSLQLPISLQTSLKTCYEKYWISDLFEVANEQGTNYYVTLENADNTIILQSSANAEWSVYKKYRKS